MTSSLSQITGLEPRDNSDKHSKMFALITTDADLKIWHENKKVSRSNYITSFTEGQ
jgi:meiotically up-regulated gene 157 (Mug157) protein